MDQRERYDACLGYEINIFCFFYLSAVCPRLAVPFLSVDLLFFRSCLSPYHRRLATILPASFASKPDSSPASGLKGLHQNIVSIGSTPPPPAAGFSLGRVSVLAQGMGDGLSSTFSSQARGKWSVHLLRLMIVENYRWLQGGFGGTPLPWQNLGILVGND